MRRRSLRLRLFLAGAGAIAAALALAGFVLVLLFEHHVERTMDDDIETYIRQLVSTLTIGETGTRVDADESGPDPRFDRPRSGFYWQIAGAGGEAARSPSLGAETLAFPAGCEAGDRIVYRHMRGAFGHLLLAGQRCVTLGGAAPSGPVRVLVALDLSGVARARDAFAAELVAALALIAAGLVAATWIQVGLGLAPLAGLGAAAREIAEGRRRRLDARVPPEVAPLVDEVNGLLDERDRQIERARNRAADLAHGLKTPLTALAADARLLREKGEAEIARSLERVGEAMRRHVERELARARSVGAARGREATPIAEVADALARTLVSAGARAAFDLRVAPGARIAVDRVDLMEILGNLMENAARHARSRVLVAAAGGRLVVEDDGPGLPEGVEALIRRRGGRLDETGSAGLGLAIVADVLEAYGATMALSRAELGGLRVEVDLSRAFLG